MQFTRVLKSVSLAGLSIFLTLVAVLKPILSLAADPSCVHALSANSGVASEQRNLLSEFLLEDPGFNLSERFFRYRTYVLEPEVIAKS